jgi:hypothetical protein
VSVSGGGSSTANATDSTTVQAATSWTNGYTYQRAITIAYTPNSNQTNFPVLISGLGIGCEFGENPLRFVQANEIGDGVWAIFLS